MATMGVKYAPNLTLFPEEVYFIDQRRLFML